MRGYKPRVISVNRSLIMNAIIVLTLPMCSRGLGQDAARATGPAASRRVGADLASRALRAAFEAALPQPELEFLDQILVPAMGPNTHTSEQMSALGRWLLRNEQTTRGRQITVPACVVVFTGTSDKAHPDGVIASTEVIPGQGTVYLTWIRMLPAKVGVSAKVVAMVDVIGTTSAEKKIGYVSEATFQLKDGKWELADLRTKMREARD
jgi:hypothetical protein